MKIGSTDITAAYLGSTSLSKVYVGSTEVWSSFTGLLDTYTGAAAAYSLRQLRSAYTGSAIKVRRASDNTEQDIGFSNNELDTTTLASFCSGTNGFVTTWYDQSGNGRHALQTTAANQPQIVSSGSVLVNANGTPKIASGANQGLSASFGSTISQPTTIFVVGQNGATSSYLFDGIDATNRQARLTRFVFAGNTIDASNNEGFGLESILYNGASSIYRRDGSQFSTGNAGANGLAGVTLLCRYTIAEGSSEMSEFVLYASNKSSDFANIETNINDYYAIY